MGHFNHDHRHGGFGGKFGGQRGGFGGGRRPMHQAVCSSCGADCEVPFRPTGDRPVFCSNCFEKQGKGNGGRFEGNKFAKPSFQNNNNVSLEQFKAQLESMNAKLDKILRVVTPAIELEEPHEEVKALILDDVKEVKVEKKSKTKAKTVKKGGKKKK